MCKLPKLLQYFKVPPNATHAELRQAYLQRAKLLHPDKSQAPEPGCERFQELQDKFEQASELMQTRDETGSNGVPPASKSTVYGYYAHQDRQKQEQAKRQGAPTIGLPSHSVYACATALASAAAFLWILKQSKTAPTVTEGVQKQKKNSTEVTPALDQPRAIEKKFPELQSGPWNVALAREAAQNAKTVWAPSKAWEFQDSDNFYESRTRGHMRANIGQRAKIGQNEGKQIKQQGFEASHQPHLRDGVEMLPVHIAAADGSIWNLEFCGASLQCRGTLGLADSVGNTPLHHSAKNGQVLAASTLLRLGASPSARNKENESPLDLAKAMGHDHIVELLQRDSHSEVQDGDKDDVRRVGFQHSHPDGLGVLASPPEGIVYTGLQDSGVLRRAINMAAGYVVTPPLPITRGLYEHKDVEERMVNVARGGLQSTDFDLDDCSQVQSSSMSGSSIWASLDSNESELRGLLMYESPGTVTSDAPSHWVAIRRVPEAVGEGFVRLDPVRGPFRISNDEFAALMRRYRVWRVIRKRPHIVSQQMEQLAAARKECADILKETGSCE